MSQGHGDSRWRCVQPSGFLILLLGKQVSFQSQARPVPSKYQSISMHKHVSGQSMIQISQKFQSLLQFLHIEVPLQKPLINAHSDNFRLCLSSRFRFFCQCLSFVCG
jgi:hypothetical protein